MRCPTTSAAASPCSSAKRSSSARPRGPRPARRAASGLQTVHTEPARASGCRPTPGTARMLERKRGRSPGPRSPSRRSAPDPTQAAGRARAADARDRRAKHTNSSRPLIRCATASAVAERASACCPARCQYSIACSISPASVQCWASSSGSVSTVSGKRSSSAWAMRPCSCCRCALSRLSWAASRTSACLKA